MESPHAPENRRHKRLGVSYLISYRVKDAGATYNLSRTKNISGGGMLLMTERPFRRGVILELLIRTPFAMKPIEATGKVLTSNEVVKNVIYETNIQFSEVDRQRLAELDEFIKRRAR